VGGFCQGRVIGSLAFGGGAPATMAVSGNKIYLALTGPSVMPTMNVFETAADGSEPNMVAIVGPNGPVALDGKAYWLSAPADQSSYTIFTCTIASCVPTPVLGRAMGADGVPMLFTNAFVADPTNHQIVILETQVGVAGTKQVILRVNPNGTFTQVAQLGTLTQGIVYTPNNRPDRFFWFNQSSTTFVPTYVPTSNTNGVPIPLTPSTGQPGMSEQFFANDAAAYWMSVDMMFANPVVNGVPLPAGIVTGTAPLLYTGRFFDGVVDASNAYGVFFPPGATTTDAVSRCSLSSCSPVAIAHGQISATNFLTDSTQVYWTSVSGSGLNVYAAVK